MSDADKTSRIGNVDISFESPSKLREARRRKARLQDEIESIQFQLSDRDRSDKNGRRLAPEKYHKWRHYAIKALIAKKKELRFLKRWISDRQQRKTAGMFDIDSTNRESLLAAASNLLQNKIKDGKTFTDEELMLANLIRDRVLGI